MSGRIIDGEVKLSPQISLEYKPPALVERGFRESAKGKGASLRLCYAPYRALGETEETIVSASDAALRSDKKNGASKMELPLASVRSFEVAPSTHFGKFAVLARNEGREWMLVDEIEDRGDAQQICQALNEFHTVSPTDQYSPDCSPSSSQLFVSENLDLQRIEAATETKLQATNHWSRGSTGEPLFLALLVALAAGWLAYVGSAATMVGAMALGLVISLGLAARAINRSQIVVDSRAIRVQHGPLPWPPVPYLPLTTVIYIGTSDSTGDLKRSKSSANGQAVYVHTKAGSTVRVHKIARRLSVEEADRLIDSLNRHIKQVTRPRPKVRAGNDSPESEEEPAYRDDLASNRAKPTQKPT